MPDSSDHIKSYIEAAIHSSDRARAMVFISVTASVIVLAACLANRPKSWLNWGFIRMAHINQHLASLPATTSPENKAYAWQIKTSIQQEFDKRIYVEVPFFGVRIDINDLGLIGGFSFLIIALVLNASVRREAQNVKFIFTSTEDREELEHRFRLLAMHQVITPIPLEASESAPLKSALSRILFWPLPFTYALLILVDFISLWDLPAMRGICIIIVIIELLILAALVRITLSTATHGRQIDSAWNNIIARLNILRCPPSQ